MLSCGAVFSLREANDTEMKTTFTPYDSDDVLTATVNGSGDESKITLSAQDSSNTGARIMRFATDLAARRRGAKGGTVIGGGRTMGYERACGAWVRPGVGQRIADSDTGVDAQSEIAEGGVLLYAPAESLLAGDAGVVRRPGGSV